MKPGGGSRKGSAFERHVCKTLSLWVSNGARTDCFWRGASSGGRATVHLAKAPGGKVIGGRYRRKQAPVRQAGDIFATSPEGEPFTAEWFIECKFIKDLCLESFLLSNKGPIATFWRTACNQARQHRRKPLLIIKQNRSPILVISRTGELRWGVAPHINCLPLHCSVTLYINLLSVPYQ